MSTPCDHTGANAFSERVELEAIHQHLEAIEQLLNEILEALTTPPGYGLP